MFLVYIVVNKKYIKAKKVSIMETIIKYFTSVVILIVWLLFSIAETSYCQNSKGTAGSNNGKGIVHNDKTGIVIDIIDNGIDGKSARVSDTYSAEVLLSIPTKFVIISGSKVTYRKLNGNANSNSNGKANANSNNEMCEITSMEN